MSRKVYMRAPVINEIQADKSSEGTERRGTKRAKTRALRCCGKSRVSESDGSEGNRGTLLCGCCKKTKSNREQNGENTNDSFLGEESTKGDKTHDQNGKQSTEITDSPPPTPNKRCCVCCCRFQRKRTAVPSEDPSSANVESGVQTQQYCCCCKTITRKQARKNCVICCKKTLAFFFSHVGLCSLVVGYSIAGGFIFKSLEAPFELKERSNLAERRLFYVERLWNVTEQLNILYEKNWTSMADEVLVDFQREVYRATKEKGWNGQDGIQELQWSYTGALLYSVTVITTIGYGHIAPRTRYGRLVTIFYALVGIPLTLLCLANLGSLFGDCFRFFYKHLIRFLSWICLPSKSKSKRNKRSVTGEERNPLRSAQGGNSQELEPFDQEDVQEKEGPVRVPLFVSILLIALYIFGGAMLFSMWEDEWDYLIGSYFCFITLSTIGFGDFVPGASIDSWANDQKSVLCALYLVFGLSLIAMCFNLMQEEVKAKFRWLALKLNLIDYKDVKKRRMGRHPRIL